MSDGTHFAEAMEATRKAAQDTPNFHAGVCPECGEIVKATGAEIAADWIECKQEDCGYSAPKAQFEEAEAAELGEGDDS